MNTTARRILTVAILPALLATRASAQLAINNLGQTYTINFDTTVAGVNNGVFAGTGFTPAPGDAQIGLLDSNAWAVTGMSDGDLTFGGVQTSGDFARGTSPGAITTGGIYAFTGGSIQGVALGVQPGGADVTPGTFTLRIQNATAEQITGFTLDYVVHVADNDTRGNTFNFSHSVDDTLYTDEASLNLESGTGIGANTAFQANTRTISLANLTLAAGAFYYLRWRTDDLTGAGARDEFALDDIKLAGFTSVSSIKNYWDPNGAQSGLGGDGVWTGAGLVFSETADGTGPAIAADPTAPLIFSGLPGTVVVGVGATANNGIEVSMDGYRFTGGSIALGGTVPAFRVTNATDTAVVSGSLSGSAGLRKTGPGRLVLEGNNTTTLTGTISVQEGVLEISADNQLGAATNGVALASGTLETSASLVLNAARTLSGAGAIAIAPGTKLTVAGPTAFNSVTLVDAGDLEFTAPTPALGSLTIEQAMTLTATNGPVRLNGNVTSLHTAGTTVITPALELSSAARNFDVLDGAAAIDLRLLGNVTSTDNNGRLGKLGAGTLDLVGDLSGLTAGVSLGNTGSATDPLKPGGTLIVHANTALGGGTMFFNSGILRSESASPLVFPNAVSIAAGRLENGATFAGVPMTFTGEAAFFRPNLASFEHKITLLTDVTFAGGLNEQANPGTGFSSGVKIEGTGTLFLPNTTNSTALPIIVSGANLSVGGSLNVPVTVTEGGTLSGATNTGIDIGERIGDGTTGVVIGPTGTVNPGADGNIVAGLDMTLFTLQSGGTFHVDLQSTLAGDFDQLRASSTVTLDGNLTIALAGYVPVAGDTFTIILKDGIDPVTGTFTGLSDDMPFALLGTVFAVDYDGGDGNDVVLSVVPEPGTAAFLLGGLGLMAARRRRTQ